MAKILKPIVFHNSFEEMEMHRLKISLAMTVQERIYEMYRLNYSVYGENYGKLSKVMEFYDGLPGESVEDFYKRINKE